MKMTQSSRPKLIQQFENFLWAHSPKDWILKSIYFQKTLFISMLVETSQPEQHQKIHRSFNIDIISSRSEDICGLASDIIDEMEAELKSNESTA